MQSRANRKVKKAVAKVKSFLFLLRILKSSVRPVMTASMPPIWWTQAARRTKKVQYKGLVFTIKTGQMIHENFSWRKHPACQCLSSSLSCESAAVSSDLVCLWKFSSIQPILRWSKLEQGDWSWFLNLGTWFHLSSKRLLQFSRPPSTCSPSELTAVSGCCRRMSVRPWSNWH